jgi:nucleoside-diphosphate-sugar epimerase
VASISHPRVLITGATGFLGGYLVSEFADQGYQVVATGRKAQALAALADRGASATVAAELTQLPGLADQIGPIDYVIHAAALSTVWGPAEDFILANVEGTQAVIDLAQKAAVKRLVFISSPSIYSGRADRLAIKETEFDPDNHLNNYIRSKIIAERVVRAAVADGLDAVILRPRGLFGVGDTSIIPRLIKVNGKIGIPLLRGGRGLVDMTCVENVALAARLAAEADGATGVYNITNGEPRPFKDLLDQFFAELGQPPRYRAVPIQLAMAVATTLETVYELADLPGEPVLTRYLVCTLGYSQTLDISRAQADLGYQPRLSLDAGISQYIASLDAASSDDASLDVSRG